VSPEAIIALATIVVVYTATIVTGVWGLVRFLIAMRDKLVEKIEKQAKHFQTVMDLHTAEDRQRFDDIDARLDAHHVSRLRRETR
jgi:hypothetical protein